MHSINCLHKSSLDPRTRYGLGISVHCDQFPGLPSLIVSVNVFLVFCAWTQLAISEGLFQLFRDLLPRDPSQGEDFQLAIIFFKV